MKARILVFFRPEFLLILVLAVAAVGCVANTYRVHRAALVSPPTPPNWTGKTGPSGLTLGNSTVLWKDPPRRHPQSDSGLYVSSTQMDANLHLLIGDSTQGAAVSVWIPASLGISQSAFAAAPCLVERPDQEVFSMGLGLGISVPLPSDWYVGFSMEGLISSVPTHIVAYCLDCEKVGSDVRVVDKEESQTVGIVRFSLIAGWEFEHGRLFGGLTLRNHPTNVSLDVENVLSTNEIDPDVEIGPLYGLAGLGVEWEIATALSLLVQAYQPFPMGQQDLIYGPILGITIDIHPGQG